MIDIKLLSTDASYLESYKNNLLARQFSVAPLEELLELNRRRKEAITKAESIKANQNKMSQQVPILKKEGKDASELLRQMAELSAEVKLAEAEAGQIDQQVYQLALTLPNKTHDSVPRGASEKENVLVKSVGEPRRFGFKAKEHFELGEKLGILDFERAAKVTGARFTFLMGGAAQLERALIQYFMDLHTSKHGYTEMIPPFMANSQSLVGTSQLPKFKDDQFKLEGTDYYLIATAEIPVTNYFANEILREEDLPFKWAAYSPCFRAEAGSHGRDTKGLIRQHQFNKVELMIHAHPSQSYELHEQLTQHAEQALTDLELPYRRMALCTGDISFGAAKCYDLEVWLPGSASYREISSCSNFEDFQARRANIRFKSANGKPQYVHTINGSGLAVGRTLIAIMENYQQEDGSIAVPRVLQNYMQGRTEIR